MKFKTVYSKYKETIKSVKAAMTLGVGRHYHKRVAFLQLLISRRLTGAHGHYEHSLGPAGSQKMSKSRC